MKKIMFIIMPLFVLGICIPALALTNDNALKSKRIIVDPGHGGVDPGTVVENKYEKDLNLKIAYKIKETLEKYGASVVLTRDGDYDLASPKAIYRKKSDFNNRISLINNGNFDLYLSIHMNYLNDSKYFGPQVFYKKGDEELARTVQLELNNVSESNRNIKLFPTDVYMYEQLRVAGLLIECGFLSNVNERQNLEKESYQLRLANSISKALILYFSNKI